MSFRNRAPIYISSVLREHPEGLRLEEICSSIEQELGRGINPTDDVCDALGLERTPYEELFLLDQQDTGRAGANEVRWEYQDGKYHCKKSVSHPDQEELLKSIKEEGLENHSARGTASREVHLVLSTILEQHEEGITLEALQEEFKSYHKEKDLSNTHFYNAMNFKRKPAQEHFIQGELRKRPEEHKEYFTGWRYEDGRYYPDHEKTQTFNEERIILTTLREQVYGHAEKEKLTTHEFLRLHHTLLSNIYKDYAYEPRKENTGTPEQDTEPPF